jgi:hypothetical protein
VALENGAPRGVEMRYFTADRGAFEQESLETVAHVVVWFFGKPNWTGARRENSRAYGATRR